MSDIEIRALQKHNEQLKEHLKDQQNTIDRLETINKSHKTINGQLRTRISRLEEENKKYIPYQFQQWLEKPHIMAMIRKGANLKIATQDFEDNPNKYDDGKRRRIIFYFSALKNQPPKTQSVDGMKPIGQAMPQYTPQQMTEAQPSAPENAQPITMEDHKAMSELDDEIPF